MIEIPLNKALVAIENPKFSPECKSCIGCVFEGVDMDCSGFINCFRSTRKDGKNVIFKLVGLPKGFENEC